MIQRHLLHGLAVAACLLVPNLAQAQATADPDAIVVTGRKTPDSEVIRRLTRTLTAPVDFQVARLNDSFCPVAMGLADPYNDVVTTRMRHTAIAADIDTGTPSCSPNVTVAFVDDGRAVMNGLAKTGMLDDIEYNERKRLLEDTGPVRVASLTELRSRDGNRVVAGTLYVQDASIANTTTRQDIYGVVIVIDRRAATGKTLRQLADYAAMRGLARIRPNVDPDENSILTLFTARHTPPAGVTAFDSAYLEALYDGPANQTKLVKMNAMSRRIDTLLKERAAAIAAGR